MDNIENFAAKTFTNKNGESLQLSKVINSEKISSLTITYLSKKKEVRAKGIKGFLGSKVIEQEEKELIIHDEEGIKVNFNKETSLVTARFSNKDEFEKLSDDNFDKTTLHKSYVMNLSHPYAVSFHIGNLKEINWTTD